MRRNLFACVALCLLGCPAKSPAPEPEAKSSSEAEAPAAPAKPPRASEPRVSLSRSGPQPSLPQVAGGKTQLADLRARGKVLSLRVGQTSLKAYVADSAAARRVGLMHVKVLPEDEGMIFVYPEARRGIGFWMKNTFIPLSLAYVRDDGTIDQLLDMDPLTLESHPSTGFVRFVLEVKQGWFERHGVHVGDRIEGLGRLDSD